ncbi:class I lanthipeptide [Chitinophaga nivalis]|uniref:Class I lanthipeptide n=1 Tax=Chitinophaga nivalis TaxID=2991709 RepID=A0ABT3ILB7_9BACT|nr:class I lanthipeptide [Chitinophaga nivalis]MCW3465551.1 class I lanthipeptide [Chitinophaga nivalis]MCW3484758.1 class I lanthipeptide [Chitinophaga nivalis]
MKSKKIALNKKLFLNKGTVTTLNVSAQEHIAGGYPPSRKFTNLSRAMVKAECLCCTV